MKRSVLVGNWKMYLTSLADAHVLTTEIRNELEPIKNVEIILAPPAIWLTEMAGILGKGKISLGAQNMFYEPSGAYTGEISPLMVKEVAQYVIIGHSERREFFNESDSDVNEKVISAIRGGLTPIICVGEKKKSNKAEDPHSQLKEALLHVPKVHYKDIVVAYEPIWAISNGVTGENADPDYVARVLIKLRELVHSDTPMLYGGSVKANNVRGYAERPEIDGVLIGGASIKAKEFIEICSIWSKIKNFK